LPEDVSFEGEDYAGLLLRPDVGYRNSCDFHRLTLLADEDADGGKAGEGLALRADRNLLMDLLATVRLGSMNRMLEEG
jgi:hypothetical protein